MGLYLFEAKEKSADIVNKYSLHAAFVSNLNQIILPLLGHFDGKNHEKVLPALTFVV